MTVFLPVTFLKAFEGAVEDKVGNLFIGDIFRDRRIQLTDLELSHAWWWFLSPSFSPDGRKVIFHMPRGSSATTNWYVCRFS